jgi:crotonobetainyl-CoA:carnitine CoA-transferase CaiB-like acyl-CoA transferase
MPSESASAPLPLAGLRVLEFTQTIMGPSAGLVLADLGADVIKIEPAPQGDRTRRMVGFAAGFFGTFNRNKRSLGLDLKQAAGRALLHRLAAGADIVVENYAPGTMERLGCGYEMLSALNPRLVYCALKGFLSGPYEHRPALDEVVQFMGALAYMTGPPGQPLRAGTSVVDLMGGAFGVIAILAALRERDRTGKGQLVKSALFESTVFMMGQHMAGEAITGLAAPPMSVRRAAWGVYQVFKTADADQIFVGVTSNNHWKRFCEVFGRPDLFADPRLVNNEDRVAARPWLTPIVEELVGRFTKAEIAAKCEAANIPYAPVAKIADLYDDPHLRDGGALVDVELGNGKHSLVPLLPVEMAGRKPPLRRQAPRFGEHTREILAELGIGATEIAELLKTQVIVAEP